MTDRESKMHRQGRDRSEGSGLDAPAVFDIQADEIEVFLQDVDEHLRAIETGLLQLEEVADAETLNSVFRGAHTLKAVASAVGHGQMAELTHVMETLFDAMRESRLAPTPEVIDNLLAAVDVLRVLRDQVVGRQTGDVGNEVETILARLHSSPPPNLAETAQDEAPRLVPEPGEGPGPTARPLTAEQANQARDCCQQGLALFEIALTVSGDAFAMAARLLQAAMALAETGQIVAQHPSEQDLLEDRHDGHLWLVLASRAGAQVLEATLDGVPELAAFQVQPYTLDIPLAARSRETSRLDEDKTVRISVERLDTLMDLVGEMVTDRTRLTQIAETLHQQDGQEESLKALDETIAHVGTVIGQLQDQVMRARMLPIAQLFEKYPRLVRDLARANGKEVQLVVEGESTELDRSIIEAIGDPLMHLLRNAVDHGLELPDERLAAGKPPTGTVRLAAEHREGQIVVTVADDGRGIDTDQIRRAAASRGLLPEEEAAHLDEDQAIGMIFRPGLSTSEQVTDVSGRGVGLDVVRANVGRIGGAVAVDTHQGQGTVFRLSLPLTLAIVQTMLVTLGNDTYAIPLTGIAESLYLSDVAVHGIKGSPAIQWRGQVLPLLDLRQYFCNPKSAATQPKPAVVVVGWGRIQAGLVVDRLIGKQEIVVKPLGSVVGTVPGLSGCTILGDGQIALIVDVPGLIHAATQGRNHRSQQSLNGGPK